MIFVCKFHSNIRGGGGGGGGYNYCEIYMHVKHTNELNNIDWAIIDHLNIDVACNLMVLKIQNTLDTHAPETKLFHIRNY